MPVSLPEDVESGDDIFGSTGAQFEMTGEQFEPMHSWEDFGHLESCAKDANTFPPVFPGSFAAQRDTGDHVKFVDKGTSSAKVEPGRLERVASAAPPGIVSEALRLTDKKTLLYPWEKGRLGRIFGQQGRLSLKKPKLNPGVNNFVNVGIGISDGFHLDGTVTVQTTLHEAALYKAVVKNIVGCTFTEERASQREHALHQWWDLLRLNMAASDPGRAAVQEKGLSEVFRYGLELLDATFGLKSPGTLLKRLCAIKLFNQWQMRNFTETWIPFSEQRVWAYMRDLKETKAPASRAVSLLESIRFCHYVLKVDGALSVLESLRIKGLAAQLYANKRPWRPSDVLTVNEVEFLHHCFKDQNVCEVDRIFIGHLLHMLYARARFSDLLAVTELFIDAEGAYIEVSATLHKGARSMDAKSKLLPIVAPAVGINGDSWAKEYLELRHKLGLKDPGSTATPMLLAPKPGAIGWEDRYITSQELNSFLKRIFASGGRPIAGRKITTHSLKATGLSWCSKLGISEEHRAILARHAKSVQGATVLYSRDLLSSALRSFERVLQSIKGQTFHPDKSRSGMITPARATPAGAPSTPLPPVAPVLDTVGAAATPFDMAGEHLVRDVQEAGKQVDLDHLHDRFRAGYEDYSPGTAVNSPAVKEEFVWPDVEWDGAVIDLEEQHDLLTAWQSGSEEESSGCSDSSEDTDFEWDLDEEDDAEVPKRGGVVVKWFINVKTNVIHEKRNETTFRCGRPMGQTYVAVPALTGLRCGTCFAHSI